MKKVLFASVVALTAAASSAWADPVKQVTDALTSAIAQRVGDQVAAQNNTMSSVSGLFNASGTGGSSFYSGTGAYDTWLSQDQQIGGAFSYATDNKGLFKLYGGTGYFTDVYERTADSTSFLLFLVNVSGLDGSGIYSSLSSDVAYSGTIDANWQWKTGNDTLTRLDAGISGGGVSGTNSYSGSIFVNLEEDLSKGIITPFVRAGVSQAITAGGTSGTLGFGFRTDLTDTMTFTGETGALLATQTGWYAQVSLRSRF